MKLKDFLKVCCDTDIEIVVGDDIVRGTEYKYVEPYLENEIACIYTAGHEHITVQLRESDNEA